MPTDAEKLAIAEEIIHEYVQRKSSFTLADVNAYLTAGGKWFAFSNTKVPDGKTDGEADNPIEAIYAARQKLAAEKEAARTPEERRLAAENERLRKALASISGLDVGAYLHPTGTCIAIARKALDQGAPQ